ncbi:Uma2 family endonuclease [Paludisphaera sp.]|uniref:Uma2 family endonuclease n=1 Tax=Paludisphaera sp. TaxID=2017432 RepID=UPI00301DE55C
MPATTLEPTPAAVEPAAIMAVPAEVRLKVEPDDFFALCAANPDLRLERQADGGVIVMSPAGSRSGGRNAKLVIRLGMWNEVHGLGEVFDSSSGFTLPSGAVRAPDVAWILRDRWDLVPPAEQDRFARIAPDFVAELRSPSDTLADARAKMAEYAAQGVRLGWLIDPMTKTVEIHRPGRDPEILAKPATLSGEDVLPGFTLDLKGILFD